MNNKCLYCYKTIHSNKEEIQQEFHFSCSRKFFGKPNPPIIGFSQNEMLQLAEKVVKSQKTVTGVQPKLSLGIEKTKGASIDRFTIVGLWGAYILKPQTEIYPQLPEIEGLTMHLAQLSKITTVNHSLIRLNSGELAYLTKRIDRVKNRKLHMEDMCQLTERLTEYKYNGSHEQIAKAIKLYSANPGLDVVNFYELVLFCFLTGNNDMHLKNFSLLKLEDFNYSLAPAYDLVASELVVEDDDEELALNINGKKRKIRKKDIIAAMKTSGMNDKAIENIFGKFEKQLDAWHDFIDESFLTEHLKEQYHLMINQKFKQVELM